MSVSRPRPSQYNIIEDTQLQVQYVQKKDNYEWNNFVKGT